MAFLIVSRHPGAVQFIREELPAFANAPVIESATIDDVRGNTVAGNMPLFLAAMCKVAIAVEFTGDPPRGVEYTAEDMRKAGATLSAYSVMPVDVLRYRVKS